MTLCLGAGGQQSWFGTFTYVKGEKLGPVGPWPLRPPGSATVFIVSFLHCVCTHLPGMIIPLYIVYTDVEHSFQAPRET